MNISFYTQTSYSNPYRQGYHLPAAGNQEGFGQNPQGNQTAGNRSLFHPGIGTDRAEQTPAASKSQEMRTLLRNLNQTSVKNQNPYAVTSQDKKNGFLDLSGDPDSEEEEKLPETSRYNYKDVASKIQRAKTSISAGQAVLSAKRKVLEIKRQIAGGKGDAEELQLALTHAKRMEMVARKKKHHLELEELAGTTQKRDERQDEIEEAVSDMKSAMAGVAEEKVAEAEDDIFAEREDMMDGLTEELQESGAALSEDMMSELNAMIAEFGEEELKELEEQMEQLETLEVIDPHMSKEDLEDLKRKHRNAENKAIMKADMDYLKSMIRHTMTKGGGLPGISAGSSLTQAVPSVGVSVGIDVAAVSGGTDVAAPSIDIQL